MDTHEYKALTSSPLFVSRPIVIETISVLSCNDDPAYTALNNLLTTSPLTKPDKHEGGSSTDYFNTSNLSDSVLEEICDHLAKSESYNAELDRNEAASRFATLLDIWMNRINTDTNL